jgi:hypothetical protein
MRRHAFDALSFIFGAIFVCLAVLLSSEQLELTGSMVQLIGAGALLFLGATLLLTSRKRSRD